MRGVEHEQRAASAWSALSRDACRWGPCRAVVREGPWPRAGRASLWPYGQVLAAALDLAPLGLGDPAALRRLRRGVLAYRRGRGYAATAWGTERYYDDNAWLGLDLLQAGDRAGARRVLRFVAAASLDGGVYWVEHGPRSRHTCSTGPAAELAARLAAGGEPGARAFAGAALGFLRRELRGADGLYADHVGADGTVEPTLWSYNQGTPVGAGALWHRLTGDGAALVDARETADAALAHFSGDRLWSQAPAFNAIFFRNLLLLDALTGYPPAEPALAAYLDRVWEEARDPVTGWFTRGGIGRYERGGSLDQAGLVQLYALAAWPRSRRTDIC